MSLAMLLNIIFAALSQAAVLSLVTLGIVLIFRTSYTTNFAQGSIGTLMAFFVTMFYTFYLSAQFPALRGPALVVIAILTGIILGFLLGLFIDIVLIRQSKFPNPLTKQMITMGIVLVLTGLIPTIYADVIDHPPTPRPLSTEIWRIPVSGGTFTIPVHNFLTIVIAIVVIGTIFALLKYTKWGLGVRATASNERVASMMGVNTRFITAMSWGIAAGIGSLAAALYAPSQQTLTVGMMVFMQVNGFLAAVLGGFTTFFGPVVGAIMIPLLTVFLYRVDNLWNIAMVYMIILLIVLIKPVGLFGKKIAKKV
ncbi:MAG: branched-chain amino acid ABC transporter permease [Acholeplasmataceae bacterium]|nr:MAG: branched-chain amino acid ABC transporter permease [Acholeplasmataceae bacterium]